MSGLQERIDRSFAPSLACRFERLSRAQSAHEAATELEALVSLLPSEKSRQLAQLQVKASHRLAKDFRELAQKVKES
jgi:hypothetical protein